MLEGNENGLSFKQTGHSQILQTYDRRTNKNTCAGLNCIYVSVSKLISVELVADYGKRSVQVKQLGTNSCFVNGKTVTKNDCVTVDCSKKSARLCFLENKYPHSILFKDQESSSVPKSEKRDISDFFNKPKTRKRKSDLDEETTSKKAKLEENRHLKEEHSDSEDEHEKKVREQLELMQQNFKKTEASAARTAEKVPVDIYSKSSNSEIEETD